jgi:membrane associated rhomboid family serine protease
MPDERSRRKRARKPRRVVRLRDVGRKMALLAAANILLSLLLPWIQYGDEGINAFELASMDLVWVEIAVWPVLVLALAAGGLAFADRMRSLGWVIGAVEAVLGVLLVGLAGEILVTIPLLRQVGVVAMGVGGFLHLASGVVLLVAPWSPSPRAAESVFARPGRLPWVTITLAAMNTIIFLALAFRDDYTTSVMREWGIIGGSIRWYAPLTSMFLHAGWLHLVSNVAVLVAVGAVLERRVGRIAFAVIYLVSGVAGALLSAVVDPRMSVPLVGASGGVAGLLAACAVVAPGARVRVWFHAVVTAGRIELRASWLFAGWFALQALGGFYLAIGSADHVAYWCHIGGVALGAAAGIGLRAGGLVRPDETGGEEAKASSRRRHGGKSFVLLPHVIAGVCVLVSVASVALTFTSGSLMGALARFERAWNSGRIERVEEMFRPESREELGGRLREALATRDDDAAREGGTGFRVALSRTSVRENECLAAYLSVPEDRDPYRVADGGRVLVTLVRSGGTWWVRALDLSGIDPDGGARRP